MMNPQVIHSYSNGLNVLMTRLSLHDNIWNCDETDKQFEHQPLRLLAEKGSKSIVGRVSPGRTNITIMTLVNAAGKQMPPLFSVKGKNPEPFVDSIRQQHSLVQNGTFSRMVGCQTK